MNKYLLLALFLGSVQKIYDDLYDNNMYAYFGISETSKSYVNEFLKCVFGLGYATMALKDLFFYIWFSVIQTIVYFFKKSEFGAYEFSGLLSSVILLPFLNWSYGAENKKDIVALSVFTILTIAGCYIIEKLILIDIEYSYSKLITRGILSLVIITSMAINSRYLFFPPSIYVVLLFVIGYLLTSCVFQYILLKRDKSADKDVPASDEEITLSPLENEDNAPVLDDILK